MMTTVKHIILVKDENELHNTYGLYLHCTKCNQTSPDIVYYCHEMLLILSWLDHHEHEEDNKP